MSIDALRRKRDTGADRDRGADDEQLAADHDRGSAGQPVPSKPGGPVIQSITAQIPERGALTANMIIPQFHFIAPNGNAVLIHRELVATSANNMHINPSAVINIPADAQKQGAIVGGGFNCNTNPFYVTLRAWIMDADGNRSNEVQYTIHCNGG